DREDPPGGPTYGRADGLEAERRHDGEAAGRLEVRATAERVAVVGVLAHHGALDRDRHGEGRRRQDQVRSDGALVPTAGREAEAVDADVGPQQRGGADLDPRDAEAGARVEDDDLVVLDGARGLVTEIAVEVVDPTEEAEHLRRVIEVGAYEPRVHAVRVHRLVLGEVVAVRTEVEVVAAVHAEGAAADHTVSLRALEAHAAIQRARIRLELVLRDVQLPANTDREVLEVDDVDLSADEEALRVDVVGEIHLVARRVVGLVVHGAAVAEPELERDALGAPERVRVVDGVVFADA